VFPLWEATNSEYTLSAPSKGIALKPERKKPVQEYLKTQGRFRHLFTPEFEHLVEKIQTVVDKRWQRLLKKNGIA
jgi:pyruvate ferredoxin oxidoreductase beta subunit